MRAIAQTEYGGVDTLKIVTIPDPTPGEHDIVVRNHAAGVNPIDFKVRSGGVKVVEPSEDKPLVIGWDGAGVVEKVGAAVTNLKVGDKVYYAGDIGRPGSYAELTAVDARITAKMPNTLSFTEAATIPLVALTGAEILYDAVKAKKGQTVFICNGAGGVGSFTIQLAKALGLRVIATASRPETIKFVKELGADVVVSHRKEIKPQLEELGEPTSVDIVIDLADNKSLPELLTLIKPGGAAALIWAISPEIAAKIDWMTLFMTKVSIHHEFMFSRPVQGYEQERQGELLALVAEKIDSGAIKHVVTNRFGFEEAAKAHELQETGAAMGKSAIVITEDLAQ